MDTTQPKLLLVDDEPENIDVLLSSLKNSYELFIAKEGQTSLKLALEKQPDLILLDIMMPNINGYEVCKKLKKNIKTKDIPIIFLSARADNDDVIKGLNLGAVDYITKPFIIEELLLRVKIHVELKLKLEKIKSVNKENKDLLRILSHDLSNSIGAMRDMMRIANKYPSKDILTKNQLLISTTFQNAMELLDLVKKLRAIEEKIKLKLSKCNLLESVEASLYILKLKLEAKDIKIQKDVPVSFYVFAERVSLINSVLNNILTNAIKFSFPGGVIEIQAYEKGENIYLSIKDYGIGIPQSLLKNIFNLTEHTTRDGTIGEKGTGFGMPLVKKFIDAFEGEIQIHSQEQNLNNTQHGTEIILKFHKV